MDVKGLTLEQLVEKWEDRRELQNLMGAFTCHILLKREKDIFADFWTRTAEPCLGFNGGYYQGREAVAGYYEALHRKNELRTKLLCAEFPEQTAAYTDEQKYGMGVVDHKPLSNQIIEIAGDGLTAKAFWAAVGKYDELTEYGPLSFWTSAQFGVDFIREDDGWKIWHLLYVEDVDHPCGEDWAKPARQRQPLPQFAAMKDFRLPAFTAERQVRALYSPERPFTESIPLPEEYDTFAETFSYGLEEGMK